ncbi:hypothetical protein A3A14_01875 [Candidatus Daviesbacteria bacterium RIFCSPLOWO2_01_FULL_43_38]|uniref:Endolytic murein transglycosylase n=2 Tax=Candidatus Daviesiibacteriota TaxID=1752718 RepID=A0A1F5K591_9BACT|nr:MAG: Aminodeoxychorismate lyase [Candidatus Daviesbacteria bacterium GW2011_GWA1_42_6]OGE20186.1 MAG: hypothetical protein A2874_03385 [Candidatus Daviesbacteria bacterium RIFCSPHIGHO2_01_FULL_43_17]OGE36049.1 MAG: hypothetical protein A3E45_03900 [Candidatus Daviesbacteria bacterium RIFCSPHIGHO2_12_FULL_43_11]OGE63989.1 MAG: hypothetical protein A3A14_01875 [Candidatus Daviesbacteria bacterium RIFCSPLOWO2_01_FULL_43_38]OGE69243.1 MAG: hypothetical protein A3J21_02905 [Candidatus Daviesbacte
MKNRNFKRNWLILIVVLGVIFFGVRSYWGSLLSAPQPNEDQEKVFVIAPGEATSSIIGRLEKEGLIKSSWAFNFFLKNSGQSEKIQAGDFKLSPSMDAEEILQGLTTGRVDKWVTLLEGWRVEEMAKKLNDELGIKNEEFLKVAKEGYMFPDTYLFNPDVTASDIALTMRNNFNRKYDDELQNKIKKLGLSPEEGVILASILEREGRSDEVRRTIAGILLKRLKIDMGLNADATIQYALIKKSTLAPPADGWWKRHLTREDLKINSPYNTYLHRGLPPTPIANPSLSSLQAVANADLSTPYLYYYHDSQGRSHYGKTLDEHNTNVASYP